MKVRIRFSKEGDLCYVGHLDMMRYFQKAIRRAHLDIAYSQGFNPHQILSFASPLGLGMTSTGEYFDAEMNTCPAGDGLVRALSAIMTEGVRVLGARRLPDEGKNNAMASLTACSYRVEFNTDEEGLPDEMESARAALAGLSGRLPELWESFTALQHIPVTKQTKTRTVDTDLRPLIIDSRFDGEGLFLLLAAGSAETVKVTAVLTAFFAHCGASFTGETAFKAGIVRIERLDQFTGERGALVSLGDIGEEL